MEKRLRGGGWGLILDRAGLDLKARRLGDSSMVILKVEIRVNSKDYISLGSSTKC